MTLIDFGTRLLLGLVAGFIIGFERQWNYKSAGLRTNTLVSLGSTIYVVLSISITNAAGDVTRIIGQVVTGVGFLCGGVIFKEGSSVHGLTTAVTIWCSSAVGCLAGAAYFKETMIATMLVVFVNVILKPIDRWLNRSKPDQRIQSSQPHDPSM
ncbi:MAG TPA: MgtC/SapB family protein [Saprospiraceae bacterium]|nr:MgtC/SapB family protein [Saprospiraceae bacterium]